MLILWKCLVPACTRSAPLLCYISAPLNRRRYLVLFWVFFQFELRKRQELKASVQPGHKKTRGDSSCVSITIKIAQNLNIALKKMVMATT